ncbi:hypothetical protein MJO29_001516, partial [Puccinia striiformis f. sp. tritici]
SRSSLKPYNISLEAKLISIVTGSVHSSRWRHLNGLSGDTLRGPWLEWHHGRALTSAIQFVFTNSQLLQNLNKICNTTRPSFTFVQSHTPASLCCLLSFESPSQIHDTTSCAPANAKKTTNKTAMVCLSFSSAIFIGMMTIGQVSAAPSQYKKPTGGQMSAYDEDTVSYMNGPSMSSFSAQQSSMNQKVDRLRRRSSSSPRIILMPAKSANSDLAESLLDAANTLSLDTAAVYSSISLLKKNGHDLGKPEQLGDNIIFQLTDWQKHADMLRFLGDVEERPEIAEQVDAFRDDLELTLKSAAQALKQTLRGVNSIISEMPSIQYLLGPMVYNIRTIIADIHHRSDLSKSNFEHEDFSMCSSLESIKQFC